MGVPDHLTCHLRKLYPGQEATVRTGHGTTDWFQIGKGVHQGYILSPCLFNLYAEYIMRNAGLEVTSDIPPHSSSSLWHKFLTMALSHCGRLGLFAFPIQGPRVLPPHCPGVSEWGGTRAQTVQGHCYVPSLAVALTSSSQFHRPEGSHQDTPDHRGRH